MNKNPSEYYIFKDCPEPLEESISGLRNYFADDLIIDKAELFVFSKDISVPFRKIKVNPSFSKSYCKGLIKSINKSISSFIKILAYDEGILFFQLKLFYLEKYNSWFMYSKLISDVASFSDDLSRVSIESKIHKLNKTSNFDNIINYLNSSR